MRSPRSYPHLQGQGPRVRGQNPTQHSSSSLHPSSIPPQPRKGVSLLSAWGWPSGHQTNFSFDSFPQNCSQINSLILDIRLQDIKERLYTRLALLMQKKKKKLAGNPDETLCAHTHMLGSHQRAAQAMKS